MHYHFLYLFWSQLYHLTLLDFWVLVFYPSVFFLNKIKLPISLGQVQVSDNIVVLTMASIHDIYHILCPPNSTPSILQSIRSQPSLTSTRACVNFTILHLPFLTMESWMYLNSPSSQAIVLPLLLYYGFSMLVQGPLETSSSQSSMQEVAKFLCFGIQIYICWSLSSCLGCNTKRGMVDCQGKVWVRDQAL